MEFMRNFCLDFLGVYEVIHILKRDFEDKFLDSTEESLGLAGLRAGRSGACFWYKFV